MSKRFGQVALECLLDLGVTVVYAIIAGLLIVAIVASDDGPISLLRAGLYALLLPMGAIILIGFEVILQVSKEWRTARREGAINVSWPRRCRG
jgi:hypothetical protein